MKTQECTFMKSMTSQRTESLVVTPSRTRSTLAVQVVWCVEGSLPLEPAMFGPNTTHILWSGAGLLPVADARADLHRLPMLPMIV